MTFVASFAFLLFPIYSVLIEDLLDHMQTQINQPIIRAEMHLWCQQIIYPIQPFFPVVII